ncbi:MAG: glyceraldehyde 3-phosphate dehydrogenase NAD-binding domain-containing protein [bacterium]|nr:glyceraldehyde 3-phosphate dehydrogenase NAD-binding domain-containing protein [bacterium]
MQQTNIAINGFGRIGLLTARVILGKYPNLKITAVNDLSSKESLLKKLRSDELYGKFNLPLKANFFNEKDPEKLPWKKLNIDLVLECTGFFKEKETAQKHLLSGAKKVIISAPSQTAPTYLLGVNFEKYKGEKIISMGSCTTNASASVLKVLNDKFGVEKCFLNTVHSYTQGQNKVYPNWRKDKASVLSIIPHTTGASKSIEKALPSLKGKIEGLALRVPTATVSIVDLTVLSKKKTTTQRVNQALKQASLKDPLKGILKISTENEQFISTDLKGSEFSSVVQAGLTEAKGNLIRVLSWYDNEWAYACRLAQLANAIATRPGL